ncbi:hypothetical protein TIFTF001_036138 [Ficus carica]|uniref:DUF8039 domain-containing protein n=1 Tax=Ficus carica TaxID=3494 RepID=A0AA88E4P3_FICCA|nr:hypothetical protein TIFTF001_036138 [Ficus carica]
MEKKRWFVADSWIGSDGELKDPACKKVSELIMAYNTQESQGTFESVGTSDVLTQALSRPEHPGLQSMRREKEKLKALVRGLCANKDVEPSFDQENVPTMDQHNSFKASCSVQEKQHGVSDPPTMQVDSQEFHGIPLGEGNVQVLINVPKLKKVALPIPKYEATTVEDAVNGFVAWPKTLVELDTSMNKDAQQHEALFDFNKMNTEMRPLAYYAHSSMRQGRVTILIRLCRYLEELCRINGQAEKFVFVAPTLISPVRTDNEDAGMRD